MNHKTVPVTHDNITADIDEDIAPLILELWKRDMFTFNSCQENKPGIVWIQFASFIGAEEFLNLVCDKYSPKLTSLYQRISEDWNDENSNKQWTFTSHIEDFNLSYEEDDEDEDMIKEVHDGKPEFNFSVSVRFPRSDLKNIFKKLGIKDVPPSK